MKVVLADGTLTNINATSNSDLYRALKGGGNNFGIVTRFDLATFPQGNLSVTSLVNDVSERTAVFKAFTDIVTAPNFDVYTSLVASFLYNSTSKGWTISSSAVYTRPVLNPPALAELSAVPNLVNKTSITSLAALANEAATNPL